MRSVAMNLLQTIRVLERCAALQPNVRTIVRNDVFRLNACPDVDYGAVAWLQGEHTTEDGSNLLTYNFTLFYVDRLTEDKGNEVEVQSQGIETLENILRSLPDLGLYPGAYSFRTFNQRFADECAGVFCTVALQAAKDALCPEAYEFLAAAREYSPDYNEDYKWWTWKVSEDKTVKII